MAPLVLLRTASGGEDAELPSTDTPRYVALAERLLGEAVDVIEERVTLETAGEAAVGELSPAETGGVLAFEYCESADPFRLGFLCAQVAHAIDELGSGVRFVVLRVTSVDALLGTRLTDLVTDAAVRAGDIGVLVADDEGQGTLAGGTLDDLHPSELPTRPVHAISARVLDSRDLDLAFGHFALIAGNEAQHTNVLPRLERLVGDPALVGSVREAATTLAGRPDFLVSYVGESLLELQRLALEVAGGDITCVVEVDGGARASDGDDKCVVMLTELVGPSKFPDEAVRTLNRRGWASVRVLALCAPEGAPTAHLVPLPSIARVFASWECPYCRQGAPVSERPAHLSMAEFHPKEFWDLLSWDDGFRQVGHWPSPVTPNHFNLRILVRPIFEVFGRSIAERMRNALVRRGVLPSWIDGIICTTGDESTTLVPHLAEVFGIEAKRILRVPSSMVAAAAGPGVKEDVENWIHGEMAEIAQELHLRNVVLVDQAAHHFRTLFALRKVAAVLGAQSLAFCVFVDRSGFHDETQAPLAGLHYVPLYSWESPPWLSGLCPCGRSGEGEQ